MAHIFKKTTVKERVERMVIPNFDNKVQIIKNWYNSYVSGELQKKNERQCEQEYINDIFKQVLGYTGFPASPHTIIPQISSETSSQRPDAGVGYFNGASKRVFAVVEIKDANTNLEQSQQREGNLSPIQQAFKYKPQYKECKFVIATNIFELRLFQDNQLDYEVFTLKSLADPANDYFELKRFILLLGATNFVAEQGPSKTEELLTDIRVEQEKITRKFYKEYSDIRLKLMRDIWKNNPTHRKIAFVANKAQKLLDRIVFVSFCEDTGLLPDNTLHSVYKHAETSFSNVWDVLKGFFHAIDSGSKKLGIPDGYNGGLFYKDEELDSLQISDAACSLLKEIARYDFENELSVNILGHVFEQSITDLEEIKKKVEPDEEAHRSKRKKDGIYYTPQPIIDYIVENSLGRYLRENEERIFNENGLSLARSDKAYRDKEIKALQAYQGFLHNIKVVDPACGSGAFLIKVFDYLYEENRRVGARIGGLFDQDQIFREILKNNIFGVDLNEESVRITQLSLWLKTAQKGKKLTYLDENIKCGNSIIDDESVIGVKAFSWDEKFTTILKAGGFDVVVGNPPWGASLTEKEKEYIYKRYQSVEYQIDTYTIFIERAASLLKKDGFLGYITPSTWLNQHYFKKIRSTIISDLELELVRLYRYQVFENVTADTCTFICKKTKPTAEHLVSISHLEDAQTPVKDEHVAQGQWQHQVDDGFNVFYPESYMQIINKIYQHSVKLADVASITVGIKPYQRGKGKPKQTEEDVDGRIYDSSSKIDTSYRKYVVGKDIHRWIVDSSEEKYLKYGPCLAEPRTSLDFSHNKIVVRQTGDKIIAAYDKGGLLDLNNVHNIISKDDAFDDLYLLSILNSRLADFVYQYLVPEVGRVFAEVKAVNLSKIPIPNMPGPKRAELVNKADRISQINHELHAKIKDSVQLLKSSYSLKSAPQSFKELYRLDWDQFITEFSRQSVVLNLSQQEELQHWFTEKKTDLSVLYEKIKSLEKEIDLSIYGFYQLADEEVIIIEKTSNR